MGLTDIIAINFSLHIMGELHLEFPTVHLLWVLTFCIFMSFKGYTQDDFFCIYDSLFGTSIWRIAAMLKSIFHFFFHVIEVTL